MKVLQTGSIRIDNDMPIAIEADLLAMVHIDQENRLVRSLIRLSERNSCREKQEKKEQCASRAIVCDTRREFDDSVG